MSTIPAKETECNRENPDVRDHTCVHSVNRLPVQRSLLLHLGSRQMRAKLCTRPPYTPRDPSGHYDPKAVFHLRAKCDGEQVASTNHHPRKTHRRQECATVFNTVVTAQPSVARSVRESLASCGTTPGEPPSAQRSAPTASRLVEMTTADFYLAFRPPNNGCGDNPAAISPGPTFRSKEVAP
jgi:hypothetical protein